MEFCSEERKGKERKDEILLICVGSGIDWGGERKGKRDGVCQPTSEL